MAKGPPIVAYFTVAKLGNQKKKRGEGDDKKEGPTFSPFENQCHTS